MPFPTGTMVEVTNDRVPWYGQVAGFAEGSYSVRVGGTNMTVDVAERDVHLHPTAVLLQRPEQTALTALVRRLGTGGGTLGILSNMVDRYGPARNNRIPAVLAEDSDRGAVVTVANVHALMLLMSSSQTHVIMADYDPQHIKEIFALIRMAEESSTTLEWYARIIGAYGDPGRRLIRVFLNKYRPRYMNLLALKQCRARLHHVQTDLAVEGGTTEILHLNRTCAGCRQIGIVYASDIELYLGGSFNTQRGNFATYRSNILGLMGDNTILIRGVSNTMSIHNGLPAAQRDWAPATDAPVTAPTAQVAPSALNRRRPGGGLSINTNLRRD